MDATIKQLNDLISLQIAEQQKLEALDAENRIMYTALQKRMFHQLVVSFQ